MKHPSISAASDYCEMNKYRLTQPRLQILKIIAASNRPIGAYDILKKLGHNAKNPNPPTVYRAIEFWQKHGFIHRIECLNAYMVCDAGHRHQGSQFMICDDCGDVTETHLCNIPQTLQNKIDDHNFVPSRWNFEIHGLCGKCI